ncbi:PAS domain S-box protein [Dapis sp. BLCC M126]|uniref:PAS domain S-box protein n=1 Tax=Dapis sp. BLCC M126 TaxID=3400189 RepID=UPI003CE88D49
MGAKHHSLLGNAVVGIYQTKLEGCYISANDTLAHIYGYEYSTEIIAALPDIKHQLYIYPHRYDQFVDTLREKGEVSQFESQIYRRDGTIIWISENAWVVYDEQGDFLYYEGIVEDITPRKQVEAALREREERQKLLIESLQDYALYILDSDGYVVSWNSEAEKIYQHQAEEIIGKHFSVFYTQKDIDNNLPYQELQIAINEGKCVREKICLRQDKRLFLANVITTVMYDKNKQLKGFSQITRDISDTQKTVAIAKRETPQVQAYNQRFDDLDEYTKDGIILIDKQGIFDCNQAALELFGCSKKSEFCGKKLWEFSPIKQCQGEDSILLLQKYLQTALQSSISHFNWRYKRLSGSEFIAEVIIIPVKFDGRSGWEVVVSNITSKVLKEEALKLANEELGNKVEKRAIKLQETIDKLEREIAERHQTEARLRLSEEKFSKAFSSSPDPMIITTFEDDRLIEVNDSFLKIMGYCREELIGYTLEELGIWVNIEEIIDFRQNLRKQVVLQNQEYEFRVKSGETRICLLSVEIINIGNEICCLAVIKDITDSKNSEKALWESQRKLATLMSNLPGMAYRFRNDINRSAEFVSEGCYSLTGYQAKDFIGSNQVFLSQLIHPEDRQRLWNAIEFAVQENRHYQVVYRITTKTGKIKWVWEQGIGVFSESGKLIALEGFITDITDTKNAEASLKQSQAELRQQKQQLETALQELNQVETTLTNTEKMSSLGQLVAGIAHEINNPVTSVYGNILHLNHYVRDMMNLLNIYQEYSPSLPEQIEEQIEDIDLDFMMEDLPKVISAMQIGAERIREIVRSLRSFSRKDDAQKTLMNIHDGIDGTLVILKNRLKGRGKKPEIKVYKEYGELPLVECYVGMINQVFMNLIGNGIDALEESIVRENWDGKVPTIWIRTTAISKQVQIRIIDNGLGMNEEVKERLFEKFFTTKAVDKGTGLGLSISYKIIVEKHGGRLECISAPGKGAEFIIEIPIEQPL